MNLVLVSPPVAQYDHSSGALEHYADHNKAPIALTREDWDHLGAKRDD